MVNQFFPAELMPQSEDDPDPVTEYVTADFDQSGRSDYIVAAYGNGTRVVLRVLKKNEQGATLVDEPDLPGMNGLRFEVELIDFDRDGVPEVVTRLGSGVGGNADDTWILRWTGGRLVLISPLFTYEDGDTTTELGTVRVLDADGDGKLDLLQLANPGPPDEDGVRQPEGDGTLYSLSQGKFVARATVPFYETFMRTTAKPITEKQKFTIPDFEDRDFVLRLINGDEDGGGQVDSAEVSLNGIKILRQSDFQKKKRVLLAAINVLETNELSVELRGKPGGEITIFIEHSNQ